MKQHPGIKGSSEWEHLASSLGRLAVVYHEVPPGGNATVRRVNDGEAAKAADAIDEHAEHFKDAINRETALGKPVSDGLKSQADIVKNAAKALESKLKDSKPATSEARQLFEAVRKMADSAKASRRRRCPSSARCGSRSRPWVWRSVSPPCSGDANRMLTNAS